MPDIPTFRVHFGDASYLDVPASAPAEARSKAMQKRPDQIVIKIKLLKGAQHG